MSAVCRITADIGESGAVVAALERRGVVVGRARLSVGDYVLPGGTIIERKAVRDLHLSIRTGRLWRQIGALRLVAARPVILVEGSALDLAILTPAAIRGACLAVAEQGLEVIRSADPDDTALWLELLARRPARRRRDRPVYAQTVKPSRVAAGEPVLAAIPGVSAGVARALLARFGSVAAVAGADERALQAVPGVGPTRAAAVRRALS